MPEALTRLVVAPERLRSGELTLATDEAHYLFRVRRHRTGDAIEIRDGAGGRFVAIVAGARALRLGPREALPAPIGTAVHLAFAPPKGQRADLLLEKATELGAAAFHPVVAERSVRRDEGALERFERIVGAAARQCGAAFAPVVHPARSLGSFLAEPPDGLRLVASPEAERALRHVLPESAPLSAVVLTGPEGGFSPGELAAAGAVGFAAFRLGDLVLRAETAPIVELTLLRQRFGDLG